MAIKIPPEHARDALLLDLNEARVNYTYPVGVVAKFGWFYVEKDSHPSVVRMLYQEAVDFLEEHLPEYIFGRES